jgi:hypothetical protein
MVQIAYAIQIANTIWRRAMPTTTATDHAETARRALEEVCSGRNLEGIPRDYHPDFVDHVNRFTYRGHAGAGR